MDQRACQGPAQAVCLGLVVVLLLSTGCASDLLSNEGMNILCNEFACNWEVLNGEVEIQSTWHPADPGLAFGSHGEASVEQRSVFGSLDFLEWEFSAVAYQEDQARLAISLAWYAQGLELGATFWERSPALLRTDTVTVQGRGVREVLAELAPPFESAGLVLTITKQGQGVALLDELGLTPLSLDTTRQ